MPYYAIEDQFPYGHGEKSVFLIERKMHLKIDEAMAIRWHMGEFGDKNSNTISQAYDKYPLAVKLHLADLESTFLREKELHRLITGNILNTGADTYFTDKFMIWGNQNGFYNSTESCPRAYKTA